MNESVITLHAPLSRSEARALASELSQLLGSNPEDVARLLQQERRPLSLVVPKGQAGRVLRVLKRAGLEPIADRVSEGKRRGSARKRLPRQLWKLSLALLVVLAVAAVGPFLPRFELSFLRGTDNAVSAPPAREAPPVETEVPPPPDTVGEPVGETVGETVGEPVEVAGEGAGVLEPGAKMSEDTVESIAENVVNDVVGENGTERGGVSPSLFALTTGAAPRLREALAGADPDPTDAYGQTPLMYAAGAGNADAVEVLLDAGASVNARSGAGWTALMYAARDTPDVRVAEALFVAGGDPSLRNDEGQTPLDLALGSGNRAFAAWLDEKLFQAAQDAPVETVRTLLGAGAAVEGRDAYGQTPLMYAVHKNRGEVVRALLAAGTDANARSRAGWTPLMYAARDGGADVVAALLAAGAKPSARNGAGETARDLALAHDNPAVAEVIGAASRAARPPVRVPAPPAQTQTTSPLQGAAAARAAEKAALFRCLQERVGCEDLDLP